MAKELKVTRANEIVGLFILLALALAVAALFLGPKTQRWFTPTRTIAIHLPPEGSLGLRRGGDVQILGSVVGSVDDIVVTDAGGMEAQVSIQGNFIRFVRMDSRAIIRKPLGIGDAEIEITRGHGAPLPAVGAFLESEADKAPTAIMEEALVTIRDEALPTIREMRGAISEFTKLAGELRGQQAGIAQALQHVNRVGAQLERGEGLAAMLIADPKPAAELLAALPKLNTALDELRSTLQGARALAERLPQVGEDLQETMNNARLASADARRLAAALPELEESAKRAFDTAPGLLLQSQETMYQIQRLTEGVQRSWLMRGYMDAPPSGSRLNSDRVGTER
jgi:phospholipid/cholesterol/gamma-HCH transport system substrate-binding protein